MFLRVVSALKGRNVMFISFPNKLGYKIQKASSLKSTEVLEAKQNFLLYL